MLRTMADIQQEADHKALSEIRQGIAAGMTQEQVARAMGVSPSTLCRFLKKQGWRVERRMVEDTTE